MSSRARTRNSEMDFKHESTKIQEGESANPNQEPQHKGTKDPDSGPG